MADGGRKLLLDGKRGPASEGGSLQHQYNGHESPSGRNPRAHFRISAILMRNPPDWINGGAAFEHAPSSD